MTKDIEAPPVRRRSGDRRLIGMGRQDVARRYAAARERGDSLLLAP
ncbi:hypothetical protein [Streptomyces sp. NPDC006996]